MKTDKHTLQIYKQRQW